MSWTEALRALVHERTGVAPGAGGPGLSRLVAPQIAKLGLADEDAYLARLAAGTVDDDTWQALLGGLLNGQTWFFRQRAQLDALADVLEEHAATACAGAPPADVWCAACSTGEEAYSIAMILAARGIPARVLATDLGRGALATARAGLYDEASLRAVSPADRGRWLRRRGDRHEVAPEIRARVTFHLHNLLDAPPPAPRGAWSAIVCRNALIYFEPARAEDAVHRLLASLDPGGVLVLGSSEALAIDPALRAREVRGQVVFGAGPAATAPRSAVTAPPAWVAARARATTAPPPPRVVDEDAARRLRRALDRVTSGAIEEAIAELRAVLFLQPLCWQASYLLGSLLRQRGALGEAVALYAHTLRVLDRGPPAVAALPLPAEHDVSPEQVRDACRQMLDHLRPGAPPR